VNPKILNLKELKNKLVYLRKKKKKIAFTNGCFDLLHLGHIKYLAQAKNLADILIVGINSDASVQKIKGKKRPIIPLKQRMNVLAALEAVDFVISFNQATPYRLIKIVKPDFLVKGGDWQTKDIVGRDIVESYKGKVVRIPFLKGLSTTQIIKRIVERFG